METLVKQASQLLQVRNYSLLLIQAYTPGQSYTIMTAPDITGQFSSIIDTVPASAGAKVNYYSGQVVLVLTNDNGSNKSSIISTSSKPTSPDTGYGMLKNSDDTLVLGIIGTTSLFKGLTLSCKRNLRKEKQNFHSFFTVSTFGYLTLWL